MPSIPLFPERLVQDVVLQKNTALESATYIICPALADSHFGNSDTFPTVDNPESFFEVESSPHAKNKHAEDTATM